MNIMKLSKIKRVAIIGGGFGGLAVTWQFSRHPSIETIDVYDRYEPGFADASSNSAGIMHSLTPKGKIIWNGIDGMNSSIQLMNAVQPFSHDGLPIYNNKMQLQRLIFNSDDLSNWNRASIDYPDEVELLNSDVNTGKNGNIVDNDGSSSIYGHSSAVKIGGTKDESVIGVAVIKSAVIVNPFRYLNALWKSIQYNNPSAQWHIQTVTNLSELSSSYDCVIVACGPGILNLCPQYSTQLRLVRGQNLFYGPFDSSGNNNNNNNNSSSRSTTRSCDTNTATTGTYNSLNTNCSNINDNISSNSSSIDMNIGYLSGEYIIPFHHRTIDNNSSNHLLCGATHEHITNDQYNAYLQNNNNIINNSNSHNNTVNHDDINIADSNGRDDSCDNISYLGTITSSRQKPNIEVAEQLLKKKLIAMMPELQHMKPVGGNVGTRVVSQRGSIGRLPIIGKVHVHYGGNDGNNNRSNANDVNHSHGDNSSSHNGGGNIGIDDRNVVDIEHRHRSNADVSGRNSNVWMMTGFGSRGLIHHAILSDYLYRSIIYDDENIIPIYLRPKER